MPDSYNILKSDIGVYFEKYVHKNVRILDIGAGTGTYSKLLRGMGYKMDGMEVWLPYVIEFKLNELYDNVILGNVMNYDIRNYDVIIMGDILEHLSISESIEMMEKIEGNGQMCIVAVPYKSEQGVCHGNVYEIHKQSDLTNEVMLSRYKNLNLLFKSDCYQYGYYVNRSGYYNNDMQCYVNDYNLVNNRLQINYIDKVHVEYINDNKEDLNIKLSIFDNDIEVYSNLLCMTPGIQYYTKLDFSFAQSRKFVFSGDGIYKVYVV